MLEEARLAMGMKTTANDAELASLIKAAAIDLKIAGIVLDGEISFEKTQNGVTDHCTVDDELVKRAIITYVRMNFRTPPNYAQLAESYNLQRRQLANATGYTNWEGL